MRVDIRKNLLDLSYSKNLHYQNTSIIVILTFIIGLCVAVVTDQIDFSSTRKLFGLILISFLFFSVMLILVVHYSDKMKQIRDSIKKLS